MDEDKSPPVVLLGKWKKEELRLELAPAKTIRDVKAHVSAFTGIEPHRLKLAGLGGHGKPAADDVCVGDLPPKAVHKFMVVGTKESDVFVDPKNVAELPVVFADFDCAFAPASKQWRSAKENSLALSTIVAQAQIHAMHPPRRGKKLLVLDLDHTLMDISATKDNGIPSSRFMRPHMHTFLAAVWAHFDVCIWSQTSWRWIEIKLTELGMLTTPDYRINFILDKTNMFSCSPLDNKARRTKVKALEIIWRHFPGVWDARNTVHVDDLRHNFALNPLNGIPIRRYDCAEASAPADAELLHLAVYLVEVVAPAVDVTQLPHDGWESHREKRTK
ncbi:hypothetical protein ACHHYP_13206 [Achlya hypogyna]|uniref:FCP1 homology domain-containing protein n=1 Tax=Achlya hypogyna TaxID=1202772 RepID=A0A1V9ZFR8_ACHHY|nr:hypothetical protein ACHHYP_13206 [Achlya hypogyna]